MVQDRLVVPLQLSLKSVLMITHLQGSATVDLCQQQRYGVALPQRVRRSSGDSWVRNELNEVYLHADAALRPNGGHFTWALLQSCLDFVSCVLISQSVIISSDFRLKNIFICYYMHERERWWYGLQSREDRERNY